MVNFHRLMEDLIRLRCSQPALRGERLNVFHRHNANRVIAFHRWLEGAGRDVVVVASLNDFHTLRLRARLAGRGRLARTLQ